nr:15429_t:CDS:2 [Entrophospora candida]
MVHYEMYKRDASNKCADCGKRTSEVSDKEQNDNEKIRKQKEQEYSLLSEKADKLPSELRQLWDDLESKVENEDLGVKDVKRIYALKEKIKDFLKKAEKVDINSDHWTKINIISNLFQNSPTELDNFIREHASPRTIDIAKKGKYSKIRDCSHLKEENNISLFDFFKTSTHDAYDKLSSDTFSSQEELKTVYLEAEKDLQSFLKKEKPDKTSEEETELDNLRKKLKDLDKKTENNSPPTSYLP